MFGRGRFGDDQQPPDADLSYVRLSMFNPAVSTIRWLKEWRSDQRLRGYAGSAARLLLNPPSWLAWTVFVVALLNVFVFVFVASNPVLVADDWYFLDTFVRISVEGHLHIADFFAKRGAMDHAQPLQKLILLEELRRFNLDMRVQAVIGAVCAAGSLLTLRWLGSLNSELSKGPRTWLWVAMCLVVVSLNSRTIWGWPLVAGGYIAHAILFALLVSLWLAMSQGRFWQWIFVGMALLFDISSDDRALLGSIALLLGLGWLALRSTAMRRQAISKAAWLLVILIVCRLVYAHLQPAYPPPEVTFSDRIRGLTHAFEHGGWWSWVLVPLAAPLIDMEKLRLLAGSDAQAVQVALGVVLLVGQLWFWYRAFRNKPNAPTFGAIVLMLLFYGFCAGIVYARVSKNGNWYLNEPRYVLLYLTSLMALLLMAMGCEWRRYGVSRMSIVLPLLVIMLMGLQLTLSALSWGAMPYMSASYQRLASQIAAMGQSPTVTPQGCAPNLPLCSYPPEKRKEIVDFLKSHRLNVFSPAFQRINRIYPVPSLGSGKECK